MTLPFHPHIASLPVYQPGRPIEEVARELGIPADEIIKVASNENPLGPSPKALDAMKAYLPKLHLYPDGSAFRLKQKLAAALGLPPEMVILGNGSNELIEFVGHVLMGPGATIVVSEYCFAIYPIIAKMFGAAMVTVPAKNFGHDLSAMVKAIDRSTSVVFVANPNNPTGTCAPASEVLSFVESIPKDVLIVMDEAYIEFVDSPANLITHLRQGYPNLFLMRTFSKIHGLAGLRLGYGMGHPDLIRALEKIRQPFNVNSLIQEGAIAALDDADHVTRTKSNNKQGLEYLCSECHRMGIEYVPSAANFFLAKVKDGQKVFAEMQRHGVITRPMGGYGLPEYIRISVGTPEENQKTIRALDVVRHGFGNCEEDARGA
jgi:histidinol-phosphate aminotransferase